MVSSKQESYDPREDDCGTGIEWASRRELITQLQEFTACDVDAAMVLLAEADWDLQAAVEAFIVGFSLSNRCIHDNFPCLLICIPTPVF